MYENAGKKLKTTYMPENKLDIVARRWVMADVRWQRTDGGVGQQQLDQAVVDVRRP
jgi:hypothetical protein